jgi:hypothetical protein
MFGSFASYLRRHHVGMLALFIALSGTAYAATLPRNSVGTAQLQKNAVTTPKIKKSAVTSRKIKRNAVTGAKVKTDSLTGLDINESALGKVPSAATADTATTASTAGVANSVATGDVNANTVVNPSGFVTTVEASCDPGLKGISAGLRVADPATQFIIDLYPVDLDTWAANVENVGGADASATLFVICGAINSVTLP